MRADIQLDHGANMFSANEETTLLLALLDARQDRMLYTYRTHEKAADRYTRYEKYRKVCTVVLTILTAGTLVTAVAGTVMTQVWGNLTVAALATLATGASFTGEFFDFRGKIADHQKIATQLRTIRDRYESLICDISSGTIGINEARNRRDTIQREEEQFLIESPRTTRKDYDKASKAITTDEKPQSSQVDIDSRTPGRRANCNKAGA